MTSLPSLNTVIDNDASWDGSAEMVAERFPQARPARQRAERGIVGVRARSCLSLSLGVRGECTASREHSSAKGAALRLVNSGNG